MSKKILVTDELYREDFNCVVCFEPLVNANIFQCCKGEHNLCGVCVKKISPPRCPIDRCEGAFIPDPRRKRIFDKMLVECPHRFCLVRTFPWLMEDHISECLYRRVVCPFCDFSFTEDDEVKNSKESKESKECKESKDGKDGKESKESKDRKNCGMCKETLKIEDAFCRHFSSSGRGGGGKCAREWHVTVDETLTHPIEYEKLGANRLIIYPNTQLMVFMTWMKSACKVSMGRMYNIVTVSYSTELAKDELITTQTLWIGQGRETQTKVPHLSLWSDKWSERKNGKNGKNEKNDKNLFVPSSAQVSLLPYVDGQILDVLDTQNKWMEAEVKLIDEKLRKVFVHYLNWSTKWDEWIPFNSYRIALHRTHTFGPNIVNRVSSSALSSLSSASLSSSSSLSSSASSSSSSSSS